MSELQIALLLIGLAVILGVYSFSWWQQRKYRRKFAAAFAQEHEDVLTRAKAEKPVTEAQIADEVELALPVDPLTDHPLPAEPARVSAADGACALLGPDTDYVAILNFDVPAGADSLALLWQKRFDFGKSVHACGLNSTTETWERVIQESHLFYAAFKLSLQLADRSGPVSKTRLDDFRDLVRDIAAQLDARAELPDTETAIARAQELDAFCAEVDQMVGLNIFPSGGRAFSGGEIARLAELHGMALQADGLFHLADANGHTVFTLGNFEDAPFQHHTLSQMWVNGLTMLLDVPRVENPAQRFDDMAALTRQIAMELRATVVDDRRVALGEPGITQIRETISAVESRMAEGNIVPGSQQARRLFS